jgi:hypothetical protein
MIHKSDLVKLLVRVTQGGAGDSKLQIFNKVLLERALVRLSHGEWLLTEKGRQFLFQWECEQFLQALQEGRRPHDSDDVVQWLTKHHFVVKVEQSSLAWHMTPRGRDWLSQLEESAA